jgi:hypothetical protein
VTAAHLVPVSALGSRIDLRVSDGDVAARLRRAWAPCLRTEDDGGPVDATVTDDDLLGRPTDELLELLTQRVTVEAIGVRAGELLMLHACAVANSDGDAVVMVGPSGMGKTTMARTHGTRWGYVTDETAAIEADGRLLSYPKPLSMTRPGLVKEQVSRDDAGLTRAPDELRVRRVLLLERREGAGEVEVEELRTVPAVALLAEHTSYLARMERPLARIAGLLHDTGGLLRVDYAEAADLAPLLEELLATDGSPS